MPNSRQRSLVKPFEPSSWAAAARGPEGRDAGPGQIIDQPCHQRRLGADHDEVDVFPLRQASTGRRCRRCRPVRCDRKVSVPGLPGAISRRAKSRGFWPAPPRARVRARPSRPEARSGLCGPGSNWQASEAPVSGRPSFRRCPYHDRPPRRRCDPRVPSMSDAACPSTEPRSAPGTNAPEITVSELSGALKRTVEDRFGFVRVRGEVSNYRGPHSSGHAYFCLKDEGARIDAVVWRTAFARMRIKPEEGMEVVATGKVTTFPGKSSYQIVIEIAGAGRHRRAHGHARGAPAPAGRRGPVRRRPQAAAAVPAPFDRGRDLADRCRDPRHPASDRRPLSAARAGLAGAGARRGQRRRGGAAPFAGFNALAADGADSLRRTSLIVARGGGSLEDLWGFNDEAVIRAAADSLIPLVSAVGHETDWTLLDHVADLRAPTPTGAAELCVPVTGRTAGLARPAFGPAHRRRSAASRARARRAAGDRACAALGQRSSGAAAATAGSRRQPVAFGAAAVGGPAPPRSGAPVGALGGAIAAGAPRPDRAEPGCARQALGARGRRRGRAPPPGPSEPRAAPAYRLRGPGETRRPASSARTGPIEQSFGSAGAGQPGRRGASGGAPRSRWGRSSAASAIGASWRAALLWCATVPAIRCGAPRSASTWQRAVGRVRGWNHRGRGGRACGHRSRANAATAPSGQAGRPPCRAGKARCSEPVRQCRAVAWQGAVLALSLGTVYLEALPRLRNFDP